MCKSKRRVRNPVLRAAAALLAKGGAHDVSVSSIRQNQRRVVDDEVADYLQEREEIRKRTAKGDDESPFSFIVQ